MKPQAIHSVRLVFAGMLCACFAAAGCDTVAPVDEAQVVVEGFLNSGQPLQPVFVHRTLSPRQPYDAAQAAVSDAAVEMRLGDKLVRYTPDPGQSGRYLPEGNGAGVAAAGDVFSFSAVWRDAVVEANGVVPPEIEILAVSFEIPEEPVSAVLLDSLALSDTLATGAYTGYIYPIEATIEWAAPEAGFFQEESWVRAQLQPFTTFSSPIVDLFLRSDEVFREQTQEISAERKTWTGVYAVSVPEEGDPLPEHGLRVSLVRSGPDYARFAASRDDPDQREPVSGVQGGIGIFAAVSVDSVHVQVDRTGGAFPSPQ
ncbi:MAG: DUF4249 family protein [Bacteroidetes bacterium SB0662_bin_6]|nr:DUF4249 family protein [Bacteroidetes bacterium SB0668_bin_1]MYE03633.1 DUF4249 family protein [Bacteroidetes bacterium SB0662_bin_6]